VEIKGAIMSANEIKFIEGPRLYLRQLVLADADGPYPAWLNNEMICLGNSHHNFPYSREAARNYIANAEQTTNNLILAIALNETHQHIGNIALQGIHSIYRSAEISILIGEKAAWGRGYAKEAISLLLAHGFKTLNLNRISCGTFSGNLAMQAVARAVGMVEEGVRRKAVFKDGKYVDVHEYGILAEEYFAQQERITA
jgi:ribosomal-protein-alanine N-acetyltransferase